MLFEYIYIVTHIPVWFCISLLSYLEISVCVKYTQWLGVKKGGGGIASCILCILCIRRSVSKRLKTVSCECKCCLGELHLIDEHVRDCQLFFVLFAYNYLNDEVWVVILIQKRQLMLSPNDGLFMRINFQNLRSQVFQGLLP